jgi:glucan phosphoethanolaminetransferase (alkaline phosphatase superfamily)
MRLFLSKKRGFNHFYFCTIFLFLTIPSFLQIKEISFPQLLFFFCGLLQTLLEVASLLIFTLLFPKMLRPLWIVASFFLLALHLVQFFIATLLDSTLFSFSKFFFGAGVTHLITGFQALNLNPLLVTLLCFSILALPLGSLLFYRITGFFSKKRPLSLSFTQMGLTIASALCLLLTLDFFLLSEIKGKIHLQCEKTLPLQASFFPFQEEPISLSLPLIEPRDENQMHEFLSGKQFTQGAKPNLYFFIIETVRKDFLSCAPHLSQFGKEHIEIEHSFANADASQLSWFSLLHGELPFFWNQKKRGSLPLHALKKLGYQIHVYSSADLRFCQMDELLFGPNRELVDTIREYSLDKNLEAWARDALALDELKKNLFKEGSAHFIFLDSPHSEYSFPPDFPLQYQPICERVNYLTISHDPTQLEQIKNRYRNAIAYTDSLLEQFFQTLKQKDLFKDAIIVVTADHGEEFFEEGALFHGSHLNSYQTSVPILLKFPSTNLIVQTKAATHIDLLPSILHYLTKNNELAPLFDGQSIFLSTRKNFRVALQQNGTHPPTEFLIANDDSSLHAKWIAPLKLQAIELKGSFDFATLLPLSQRTDNHDRSHSR